MNPIMHAVITVHSTSVSAGVFDTANSLISNAEATLKGVSVLVGIFVVVMAAARFKTVAATVIAAVVAVVAVWLVGFGGISTLASSLNGDLQGAAVGPTTSVQLLVG